MIGVLIVDDERIVSMALERALRQMRYLVTGIAASGEEAIRIAEERRPHLVLMDIKLKGGMDGIETAAELQKRFQVPVVYLTAYADEITLQRAVSTAAYGYVLKPFDERELRVAIEMALHKHEMEQRFQERQRWLNATLASVGEAIWMVDSMGIVQHQNDAALQLTARSIQESLGRKLSQVAPLEDHARNPLTDQSLKQVTRSRQPLTLRDRLLVTSQELRIPVDCTIAPLVDQSQELNGLLMVVNDLRPAAKAQATLRESEETYREVFDSAPQPALLLDPDGTVMAANHSFHRLSGRDGAEVVGVPVSELSLFPPTWTQEHPAFSRMLQNAPSGRSLRVELCATDGQVRRFRVIARPIRSGARLRAVHVRLEQEWETAQVRASLVEA